MPIGDLLAQISGEVPIRENGLIRGSGPVRENGGQKRKAEPDARNGFAKAARFLDAGVSASAPTSRSSTPSTGRPTQRRPITAAAERPQQQQQSSFTGPVAGRAKSPLRSVISGRIAKPSARPRPVIPVAASPTPSPSAAKAPPKGSFLEVMARARLAQAKMQHVGRIQHKPLEKTTAKDSKSEAGKRQTMSSNGQPRRGGAPIAPASGPGPGSAPAPVTTPTATSFKNGRKWAGTLAKNKKKGAEPVREKRIRKAAIATTGYTGTARPKPANSAAPKGKGQPGPSGPRARPGPVAAKSRPPRPSGLSRQARRDEVGVDEEEEVDDEEVEEEGEEEDLDDFIDYDDEEEEMGGGGRRGTSNGGKKGYNYRSDDSESDMEAGMDDIENEESEALRIARREDLREQELERKLKLAKEERRRKSVAGERQR